MLSRVFTGGRSSLRLVTRASQSNPFDFIGRKAPFSTEEGVAENKPADPPTQEEIEKGRQEWGIKYDDECLKFEKEWKVIAERVENEQMVYLESELSDLQKKKVDMIADKVLDMNLFELRYFQASVAQRIEKSSGINPIKINMDWPSVKQDGSGTWPPANPNWFK